MHTIKRHVGQVAVREIQDHFVEQHVLRLLQNAGYSYRNYNSNMLASPHLHITRHVYKVWGASKEAGRIHACAVRPGVPVLLVMTKLRGQAWCMLVFRHCSSRVRMVLMRYAFTDASLFNDTVCEGMLNTTESTLILTDALWLRGTCVSRMPFPKRNDLLRQAIVLSHTPDDLSINPFELQVHDWQTFADMESLAGFIGTVKNDADAHHVLVCQSNTRWMLLLGATETLQKKQKHTLLQQHEVLQCV
jgi:hypothetical protein